MLVYFLLSSCSRHVQLPYFVSIGWILEAGAIYLVRHRTGFQVKSVNLVSYLQFGMGLTNPLHDERRPGYVGQPFPGIQVSGHVLTTLVPQSIHEHLS